MRTLLGGIFAHKAQREKFFARRHRGTGAQGGLFHTKARSTKKIRVFPGKMITKIQTSKLCVLRASAREKNRQNSALLLWQKKRIEKPQVDKIDRPVSTSWICTQIEDTDRHRFIRVVFKFFVFIRVNLCPSVVKNLIAEAIKPKLCVLRALRERKNRVQDHHFSKPNISKR